jgi:hypothetical protein
MPTAMTSTGSGPDVPSIVRRSFGSARRPPSARAGGFSLERGVDTEPVRGDVFYLKGDRDLESSEVAGANLEYASGKWLGSWENFYLGGAESGRLGLTYLRVIDSDGILEDFHGLPDLFLWAGYAREWGGDRAEVDAFAWYVDLAARLERLLPGASLRYRYSHFSGDGDPTDAKTRGYDPSDRGPNVCATHGPVRRQEPSDPGSAGRGSPVPGRPGGLGLS